MTNNGHQPGVPPPARPAPRVAILLSQRLASIGAGLDLEALQGWVRATYPGARARVVPELPRRAGELAELLAASGAERLVLGPAPGELALGEVQTGARQAGLDALGIGVVQLGLHAALVASGPAAIERAKLMLAAAIARARAFPGSGPEHLKPSVSVSVSRRALFTLSVREYRSVPAMLPERCAADRGCRRCVDACPRDALRLRDLQVELSKSRCESCGLCQEVCPTGAVTFPGHSPAELDAEIGALLNPALARVAPRGILFVCRQSAPALEAAIGKGFRYPTGWLPVGVPCAGSLSPGLLLRCLALGAAGVGIAGCRSECAFGQGGVVAERVAFCQELLRQVGTLPERVKFCPVGEDDPVAWAVPISGSQGMGSGPLGVSAAGPRAAADALLHLARIYDAPADLTLTDAQSPVGVVELDAQGCTACEACTAACPTGALAVDPGDQAVTIAFDPGLCVACGLCVPRCPERERGVLRLERTVNLRRLAAGRTTLYRDQTPRCVKCGAAVAPAAMLSRIAELLGDQYAAIAGTIGSLCSGCRGVVAGPRANGAAT